MVYFFLFFLFVFFSFLQKLCTPTWLETWQWTVRLCKRFFLMPDLVHGLALAQGQHSHESRVAGEEASEVLPVVAFNWRRVKRLTLLLHVPVFKVKRGVFMVSYRHCIPSLCVLFCSVLYFLLCFFLNFIRLGSFLLLHKLALFDFRKPIVEKHFFL